MSDLERMKMILREDEIPVFTDDQLNFYISENETIDAAIYQCLIVKSENTALSVSGLSTQDMSNYFKRLAQKYRPNNSGILEG